MKLFNHLISNTPMKLLTTIAAVLISFSAFSQEKLIYHGDGIITQGIDTLSLRKFKGMCDSKSVKFKYFNRTAKYLAAGSSQEKTKELNSLPKALSIAAIATGTASLAVFFSDWHILDGSSYPEFGAVGLPLVLSSVPLAFQVKPRSSYRKSADKSIDRAITRYNWNKNTELSERFSSSALGAEVQYQDFTFSQNNKPLSLYEVNILTRSVKAGRFKLFIANRQLTRSQSKIKTRKQNALNITLGLAGVGYGVAAIGIPIHSSYGTVLDLTFISGGAALTYGGIVYLKQVSSQDRFKQSADKSFRKVAEKLNKAIKATNQ